ncbi:YdeI/OmpD-associated family protein [Parapedobacter pyrenivorans]|uniref:YdeI/OmpD-associated family protein n=1 Tax=Parapedobacter pyrenivorans TaxID=1305674 RepID=UPI0033411748
MEQKKLMSKLNAIPIMEFKTAEAFENWLVTNHDNSYGLWIKIFKKDSGKKTISYAEALDVALCYGWIDGQKQAYDGQAWLQKFCPRNAKSIWSKINIGHIERLSNEGRMTPAGLKAVEKAKADGRWEKAYDPPSKMTIPEDFLKELSKNKKAEAFFMGLNKTNLFSIGFRLQTAKKQETREKRVKEIIEMLEKGEKFH